MPRGGEDTGGNLMLSSIGVRILVSSWSWATSRSHPLPPSLFAGEPDYVDSPYVAETWNSFTSLLYLAPAVVGFWNAKNVAPCSKGARRFYVLLMSVAMVAIGSTIFHATLLYPSQLLDEVRSGEGLCGGLCGGLERSDSS